MQCLGIDKAAIFVGVIKSFYLIFRIGGAEFKNGEPRNGGEANEAFEGAVFGSVTEVVKLEALDMQIAVYYGNVANMTFHSDFHLIFGEDLVIVNEQTSLLFVKTKGEWKIVHEHHSPLNQ